MTQFDPTLLERGLVCNPGALVTAEAVIISISRIMYYKGSVHTKGKFHITIGHETVMGRISIFSLPKQNDLEKQDSSDPTVLHAFDSLRLVSEAFDFTKEYLYQDELFNLEKKTGKGDSESAEVNVGRQFALIELERPVTCFLQSLLIGSRLDADIHTSACRIAFCGKVLEAFTDSKYRETILPKIKVFKVNTIL